MASQPVESSSLELHEPDIPRPEPLRIVKHSKTISGGSAAREALRKGRRASNSSEPSEGSPPVGPDRPLTVRKKRQGRGSVLNIPFDDPSLPNPICDLIDLGIKNLETALEGNDTVTTPKALRTPANILSDWRLLEPMPHARGSNAIQNKKTSRNPRCSSSSDSAPTSDSVILDRDIPYAYIPQPRFSRSRSFLLKAIGGRSGSPKNKSSKSANSKSKPTLFRRLSRGKYSARNSWDSSSGSAPYSSGHSSFELQSRDTADTSASSRLSTCDQPVGPSFPSSDAHFLGYQDSLVLSPQVLVTPEAFSVDLAKGCFWAAIEIRGVVQCADGHSKQDNGLIKGSSVSKDGQSSGMRRYGYLHSMNIDLLPAYGCFVTEVIGELDNPNIICANQTHLILARISLTKCDTSRSSLMSDDLIADLETCLGNTQTTSLTVRLAYGHSGFSNNENAASVLDGAVSHITRLQTDATAVIEVYNSESSWLPQNSQTMNLQPTPNPLTAIIKKHLPQDQAKHAISRLADDRPPFDTARVGDWSGISNTKNCYHAVKPTPKDGPAIKQRSPQVESQSDEQPANKIVRYPSHFKPIGDSADPARKIWNEMRQTSRGGRHSQGWSSLSYDHNHRGGEDLTPTRRSSSNATSSTLDTTSSEKELSIIPHKWDGVEEERSKIMEMALRNKRSLGADTLRSIAPSVQRARTGPMGGLGLGLGVGRTWGWGPSWW